VVNQKLGMDTIAAREKREAMQMQIIELLGISTDLGATHRAASSPASHGIEPGEKTVAPWSVASVAAARTGIDNARSAAQDLLWRVTGEANAQDLASANDVFASAKWWRNWATIPRNLLSAPAVFSSIITKPKNALDIARLGPFSRQAYDFGSEYLKMTHTGAYANPWLKKPLLAANFTKPGDLASKAANLSFFNSSKPWIANSATMLTKASGVLKTGAFVATKGFGVLGVGAGIYNIVDGAKNGDGWQVADGVVGTITSLGSLAPPPVGLAFAAVGAAYTVGRWLFSEDGDGNTGIDHIVNTGKAIGNFAAEAANNIATGHKVIANAVGDAGKAVADKAAEVIDDLWPW